jgi:hypothetical protein
VLFKGRDNLRLTILENLKLFFGKSLDRLAMRTRYDGIDDYKLHLRLYGRRRAAVVVDGILRREPHNAGTCAYANFISGPGDIRQLI